MISNKIVLKGSLQITGVGRTVQFGNMKLGILEKKKSVSNLVLYNYISLTGDLKVRVSHCIHPGSMSCLEIFHF